MHLKKRILVTGGAGFLGRHLAKILLERGDEVLCVDNFFTGCRDNIAEFLGNTNFEFLRHDITFPLVVEVNAIFNLACPASPVHYQVDPVQTIKTCVHGAIKMVQDDESGFTGPMNMGNPNELTMLELPKTILAITGSSSTIIHLPLPADDLQQRRPNIGLATSRYGWEPQTKL